jgi:hypothetical protein
MKTSELTDRALDWAVAKCEGPNSVAACYYIDDLPVYLDEAPIPEWMPSTSWEQGGPIIERERITSLCIDNDWCAVKGIKYAVTGREPDTLIRVFGPTPLIAAMRCFVASRLGDEVDIPDELLG